MVSRKAHSELGAGLAPEREAAPHVHPLGVSSLWVEVSPHSPSSVTHLRAAKPQTADFWGAGLPVGSGGPSPRVPHVSDHAYLLSLRTAADGLILHFFSGGFAYFRGIWSAPPTGQLLSLHSFSDDVVFVI